MATPSPLLQSIKSFKPTSDSARANLLLLALSLAVSLLLLLSPVSVSGQSAPQLALPGTCLNSSKAHVGPLNRLEPPPGYKPLMGFGLDWLVSDGAYKRKSVC